MFTAFLVFFGAIALGALLGSLHKVQGKDVYVNGVQVELVSLAEFRLVPWCSKCAMTHAEELWIVSLLDGLLLRGITQ